MAALRLQDTLYLIRGDRPRPQDPGLLPAEVEDSGGLPPGGSASVEDDVDALSDLIGGFACGLGRRLLRLVGAGGDDDPAGEPSEVPGDPVIGDAYAQGLGAVGDPDGVIDLGGQDDGEGARPEPLRQPLSGRAELDDAPRLIDVRAREGEGLVGPALMKQTLFAASGIWGAQPMP